VSPINTSIVRQAARQLEIPSSRPWFMNKRTAVVASVLLAGVPPATWLCASQSARMTPAAAVAPVSAAASTAVPDRAIFGAGADIPVVIDDVTSGTLALADALTIQVAAFRESDRAAAVTQQLRGAGLPAFRRLEPGAFRHLVLVGPYVTDAEAQSVQRILGEQGFRQTKVVREDAGTLLP
jgi:cell division septation protein DedD